MYKKRTGILGLQLSGMPVLSCVSSRSRGVLGLQLSGASVLFVCVHYLSFQLSLSSVIRLSFSFDFFVIRLSFSSVGRRTEGREGRRKEQRTLELYLKSNNPNLKGGEQE